MANKRIYWAIQAVGLAPENTLTYATAHGVQSVGMTTTFNLEQVYELGQLEIYENIEDIPDVEVTIEKVIDGYPLLYHLATRGATSGTLVGRSNQRCQVALSIFGDEQSSASGLPQAEVNCSGMYLSSVSYTIPVEGNCTESITLVGNNKLWRTSPDWTFSGQLFDNTDFPLAASSGGVQRRENVVFTGATKTYLPTSIDGISATGTNEVDGDGVHAVHIQSINISADFGRDSIYELGRKSPYFRFINFPVEVSTAVEVLSTGGDQVSATEAGTQGNGENLVDETIIVVLDDSTVIDVGTKNKLSNVTYGGGDAGGGNATVTYNYVGYNILTVTHNMDPG